MSFVDFLQVDVKIYVKEKVTQSNVTMRTVTPLTTFKIQTFTYARDVRNVSRSGQKICWTPSQSVQNVTLSFEMMFKARLMYASHVKIIQSTIIFVSIITLMSHRRSLSLTSMIWILFLQIQNLFPMFNNCILKVFHLFNIYSMSSNLCTCICMF